MCARSESPNEGVAWLKALLGPRLAQLLVAALAPDEKAACAYRSWRRETSIDQIDPTSSRLLPLLAQTIGRYDLEEPDLARIKGAAKHALISNILRGYRLAKVLEVLSASGVDAVLIKGAAMFARFPRLASLRGCGDYDVLIPRRAASKAVSAMLAAGYTAAGARMDLFTSDDFEKIHGMLFANSETESTVDVLWWPFSDWRDEAYVDELFARAEDVSFVGRPIRVPNLADHLFLSLMRIDFDDREEIVLRAVETALLMRSIRSGMDWPRFIELVRRYGGDPKLALLSGILQACGTPSFPKEILEGISPIPELRPVVPPTSGHMPIGPANLCALWRQYLNEPIDLPSMPVAYCRGFSFPETLGRWTTEDVAVLAMIVDAPGRVKISIELRPFLPPGRKVLEVAAYAGGDDVARIRLPTSGTWHSIIEIPALALPLALGEVGATPESRSEGRSSPKGVAIVVLETGATVSPKDLGLSRDPRRLGVLVGDISYQARKWSLAGLRSYNFWRVLKARRFQRSPNRVHVRLPGSPAAYAGADEAR